MRERGSGRLIIIIAASLVASLLLLLIMVWAAAPHLIAAYGERLLRNAGFPDGRIGGVAVSMQAVHVARVDLVPGGRAFLEEIRIGFDLDDLRARRAGSIHIGGLTLALDGEFRLPGFASRAASSSGNMGAFVLFERLHIASALLSAPTSAGAARIRLGDLTLAPEDDMISLTGTSMLSLSEHHVRGRITGSVSLGGGPQTVRFVVDAPSSAGLSGSVDFTMGGQGAARLSAALASAALEEWLGSGFSGSAAVALDLALEDLAVPLLAEGTLRLTADDLALQDRLLQASLALQAEISGDGERLLARLSSPGLFHGTPAPALVPAAAEPYRGIALEGRIPRLMAEITPAEGSADLAGEIEISAGESRLTLAGEEVRLRLPGRRDQSPDIFARDLRVAMEGVVLGSLRAGIDEARADLSWSGAAGGEMAARGILRLAGALGTVSVDDLALAVSGRLSAAGGGTELRLEAAPAPLALRISLPQGASDIAGDSPALVLEGTFADGAADIRVSAQGGDLRALDLGWRLRDLDGEIDLDAEGLARASLAIADLRQESDMPLLAPLSIEAEAARTPRGLSFTASASDSLGIAVFEATGETEGAHGSADLRLYPIEFLSGAVEVADLSPLLGTYLADASGGLSFAGHLFWDSGNVTQDGVLELRDLAARLPVGAFAGLDAGIRLASLLPPLTAGIEEVGVALVDAGMPLLDGRARFRLVPAMRLEVVDLAFRLADGELSARPFSVDLADPGPLALTLIARDIDLERLLTMAGLAGLSGEGRLAGELPLILSADGVRIDEGGLSAAAGGALRYTPEDPPAFMRGDEPRAQMLRQALQNLQYEELSLTISGDLGEAQSVTLRASGRNPNFLEGRPVELNFTFSGPLLGALRNIGAHISPRP